MQQVTWQKCRAKSSPTHHHAPWLLQGLSAHLQCQVREAGNVSWTRRKKKQEDAECEDYLAADCEDYLAASALFSRHLYPPGWPTALREIQRAEIHRAYARRATEVCQSRAVQRVRASLQTLAQSCYAALAPLVQGFPPLPFRFRARTRRRHPSSRGCADGTAACSPPFQHAAHAGPRAEIRKPSHALSANLPHWAWWESSAGAAALQLTASCKAAT